MLALHKGWQAFGVELDSFCERETAPNTASIGNVGMKSLDSSKLYGASRTSGICDCGCATPPGCTGGTYAAGSCTFSGATACNATAYLAPRSGPGKNNFIGFTNAATGCNQPGTTTPLVARTLQLTDVSGSLPASGQCALGVTQYELGVAGHLSGNQFIGFWVNNDGVVDETAEGTYAVVKGTSGVCI